VETKNSQDRELDHVLTKPELRQAKTGRIEFMKQARTPITLILDGVKGNYNLGAIFRLCDGFLVERLIICETSVLLRNRKLVQAAAGTQNWVPWEVAADAATAIQAAKRTGCWIGAVELTAHSVTPRVMQPRFPAALVLGGERSGLSSEALACADEAIAIPMLGMANSLNVSTTAAIVLHELVQRHALTTNP
jgi:23S rRNA (guanosine2251-2'-O)-methyltransferase